MEVGAYKVAVGVLLWLVASAVKKDGRTLFFGAGDQVLDALLAFGADDGAEVGAFFEASVDVQCLGPFGHLRKPFLGLADHDHCAQSHAPLASSTEGRSDESVQGLVLVAVWDYGGMVLGAQVGLDTLAIGRAAGVDVLSGAVATDEADGLDGGFVEDEVDGLGGAVNNVDDAGREACFPGQLGQDHCSSGVPLRWLKDETVARHSSDGDAPQGDHCGEVCREGEGERLASDNVT